MIKKIIIAATSALVLFSASGMAARMAVFQPFTLYFSNVHSNGTFMSDRECQRIFSGPYAVPAGTKMIVTRGDAVIKNIQYYQVSKPGIITEYGKSWVLSQNPAKPFKIMLYAAGTALKSRNYVMGVFHGYNFCSGNYYTVAAPVHYVRYVR